MIGNKLNADVLVYLLHVERIAQELYDEAPLRMNEVRPKFFELGRRVVQASGLPKDLSLFEQLIAETQAIVTRRVGIEPELWRSFDCGRSFELGIAGARFHQLHEDLLSLTIAPLIPDTGRKQPNSGTTIDQGSTRDA